jgi:hypothetical protein
MEYKTHSQIDKASVSSQASVNLCPIRKDHNWRTSVTNAVL